MKKWIAAGLLPILAACSNSQYDSVSQRDCWAYVGKAIELRESGKYQESLDEIEKHGSCDKSEVRMSYFYHKGWTYHEMGKYRKAVHAFAKGLETQPDYIYAYWRRGLAYEALGDMEQAKENYRQGYEIGVKEHGYEFFEFMDKNPDVKAKLVRGWDAAQSAQMDRSRKTGE